MTLPDLFDRRVAPRPRDDALTHWTPGLQRRMSTPDLIRSVSRLAAGLAELGVMKGDRVLLLSENRPEWAAVDFATAFAGGILVPVYVSLTPEQLHYILDNSGARVAIASTQPLLDKLVEAAAGDLPNLQQILVMDRDASAPDVMHLESAATMGDDRLAADPESWRPPDRRPREDDVATIIYTSGTTGPPKGVMLTHGNLTSNVESLCSVLDFQEDDLALSFLPLCHVTQRLADYCYFYSGVRIVYVGLADLGSSLTAVRPTTFPAVPRVFEKARDAILARAAARSYLMRGVFRWSLKAGRQMARCRLQNRSPGAWLSLRHAAADRLVLSRIREGMGGRLRRIVAGGAPLNPDLMEFFLAAGLPILEGYGLTETTVLTLNRPGAFKPGTVGPALPGVELRIAADGEILARGPGICRGYYLDPGKTDQSFDDGWFRTGDLGRLDDEGRLVITGRKKDILVTSVGKNISPAPIEQAVLASALVSQIVLVGNNRKFVAALVVPDLGHLATHCARRGIELPVDGAGKPSLAAPETRALYQRVIDKVNRRLAPFEQIRKFALLAAEFTEAAGELTPTLKIKRPVVEDKYRDIIESLYTRSEGPAQEAR